MIQARGPITAWFIQLLVNGTGKLIGDHKAPANSSVPYGVVYAIDGGEEWGALNRPESDAVMPFQVTSVGARRDQAEWMADRVRMTVLHRDVNGLFLVQLAPPAGTVIQDRRPQGGRGSIDKNGDVHEVAERFEICVGPA